jgi:hypothetical protein
MFNHRVVIDDEHFYPSNSFEIFFICLKEKVIMQQNIGTL